jgi:hypothetical protein
MKVLVVESEPQAAATAMVQLEALGHEIERCQDPDNDSPLSPCHALTSGRCPLDAGDVDVVLDVRGPTHPQRTPLEDGVSCGIRRHVPVVVAGRTTPNPFDRFQVHVAGRDIVGACERAAAGRQIRHEAVADQALDTALSHRDLPLESAYAVVRRHEGGLRVKLFVPAETPKVVRDMAVVRVVGALRGFDPAASRIDIGCEVNA